MTDHNTAARGLLALAQEADDRAYALRREAESYQSIGNQKAREAQQQEANAAAYREAVKALSPDTLTLSVLDTQTAVASISNAGRKAGRR